MEPTRSSPRRSRERHAPPAEAGRGSGARAGRPTAKGERRRLSAPALAARVRPARVEDWPAIEALWAESDRLHAALVPGYFRVPEPGRPARAGTRTRDGFVRSLSAAWERVLVAEVDGAVVGFASLRVVDAPADAATTPARRVYVEALVVREERRRSGIGRALVNEVGAWARGRGGSELVLTVWAGNDAAERFYERLGFATLSRVLHRRL